MRGHSYIPTAINANLALKLAQAKEDQIAARRASSPDAYGNPFDPEGLITGAEMAAGLDYTDHRHWPNLSAYKEAVAGRMTAEKVAEIAPRVKGNRATTYGPIRSTVESGLRILDELDRMADSMESLEVLT